MNEYVSTDIDGFVSLGHLPDKWATFPPTCLKLIKMFDEWWPWLRAAPFISANLLWLINNNHQHNNNNTNTTAITPITAITKTIRKVFNSLLYWDAIWSTSLMIELMLSIIIMIKMIMIMIMMIMMMMRMLCWFDRQTETFPFNRFLWAVYKSNSRTSNIVPYISSSLPLSFFSSFIFVILLLGICLYLFWFDVEWRIGSASTSGQDWTRLTGCTLLT